MTESTELHSHSLVILLLTGDVMTGRGVDQILPHPGDPTLHEKYAKSALEYVALAERANGPIPRPASDAYIWGDAVAEIERRRPVLSLVNLETAITARGTPAPKGINYSMHPANTGVLAAAGIRACTLANNHVLDWGTDGLEDTLEALRAAGIAVAGAGRKLQDASAPLVIPMAERGRLIILAFGCRDSGIPADWRALPKRAGVNLLPDLSPATARAIAGTIGHLKQPDDIVIASSCMDLKALLMPIACLVGEIARSLLRSAEISPRRKGTGLQSAMSMLNFYINRAGKKLPDERKRVLEQAKAHLRRQNQDN